MDPTKLRDWMEVIGIFALVASLVFIGLQMKQAQEIAVAEQYQVRAIFGAEHVGSIVENEHLMAISVTELKNAYEEDELSDSLKALYEEFGPEYVTYSLIMSGKALVILDAYYFQYQQGFMEEEAWAAFRYRFKRSFRGDFLRASYLQDPQDWRESFRELCDELLAEIDAET